MEQESKGKAALLALGLLTALGGAAACGAPEVPADDGNEGELDPISETPDIFTPEPSITNTPLPESEDSGLACRFTGNSSDLIESGETIYNAQYAYGDPNQPLDQADTTFALIDIYSSQELPATLAVTNEDGSSFDVQRQVYSTSQYTGETPYPSLFAYSIQLGDEDLMFNPSSIADDFPLDSSFECIDISPEEMDTMENELKEFFQPDFDQG